MSSAGPTPAGGNTVDGIEAVTGIEPASIRFAGGALTTRAHDQAR